MSAQQVEYRPGTDERLAVELEAVAPQRDEEQTDAPAPATLLEVAGLTRGQQTAWIDQVPAKERWKALNAGDAPDHDGRWDERAACQEAEADLVEIGTQDDAQPLAQALCARCPVLAACATEAREHKAYGLWAGVAWQHGQPAPGYRAPAGRPAGSSSITRPTDDEATAWLRRALGKHWPKAADLRAAARGAGIMPRQLNRVADALGARRGSGAPWRLPQDEQSDQQQDTPVEQRPTDRPPAEAGPCPSCWLTSCDCLSDDHLEQRPPAVGPTGSLRGQRTQPRRPRPRSRRKAGR